MNLFLDEIEQTAIERIQKFSKIAKKMGFEVRLGFSGGNGAKTNWIITSDNKDCSNDKVYYICRWLNHSFMPFTAKQGKLYLKFREKYDLIHNKNNNL